jgi:ATP-binding cassette subfamily F protein 3
MTRIAPAHVDSPFQFRFAEPDKLPRPLLALEDQSTGYGERVLLTGVNLTIYPGDRIALLGRNGAGKSTLMKLLAGELPAFSGTRTDARDLAIGYFAQHQLEQLDTGDTPLGNLRRVDAAIGRGALEQEQRDYLGSFGFRGDRVFEPVGPFSGGEKARLVLALVAYRRPNLLLLDEPTNHLDLEMRHALTRALAGYEGSLVLVSHDRALLRTVCDGFLLVSDGRAAPFDGDIDDYLRWLTSRRENAPASGEGAAATQDRESRRASREMAAAERQQRLALRRPLVKESAELEARMARHEAEKKALESKLADPAFYASGAPAEIQAASRRCGELGVLIAADEERWLEVHESLESIGAA